MSNHINLLKLCVGAETVQDLVDWQVSKRAQGDDGLPRHVTRMWPKREAEIVDGGSLYWVIKGVIQARQTIVRLDEVIGPDGIRRCALVMEPEVIRTEAVRKRPFQGWRYLAPEDAPRDLSKARAHADPLPPALMAALADIGVR